jgi:hypothetical protein
MMNAWKLLSVLLIVLNSACSSKKVIDAREEMKICVIGEESIICSDGSKPLFDDAKNWFLYSPEDFKTLHRQLDKGDQCLRYDER